MSNRLVFLSVPGLRKKDLAHMPFLAKLASEGQQVNLQHSFPCVTWPSQAHMLTGELADTHGVVANGFFWRNESGDKKNKVEMWTAWNEVIERPQVWDSLKQIAPNIKTAAWFPMLSKGCGADFVCMPAPIHQPDGSEDLWCYTKPQEFYGELLEELQHFPLKHFWGPLANIQSSQWIADSAVKAVERFHPDFFYIYLPHLDYAAQKFGPNSDEASHSLGELDQLIEELVAEMNSTAKEDIVWIVASEYVIVDVDHVTFPNRILREAGLLSVKNVGDGELIDFDNTPAWSLVDHQYSHVFVKDSNPETIRKVQQCLTNVDGIESVLDREQQASLNINHERSGDLVVLSTHNSWQAYYWWLDDDLAPAFSQTVDIHRKPGYDPVELCFDMATMSVPLDATLIKGSHGVVSTETLAQGVLVASKGIADLPKSIKDVELHDLVMRFFG